MTGEELILLKLDSKLSKYGKDLLDLHDKTNKLHEKEILPCVTMILEVRKKIGLVLHMLDGEYDEKVLHLLARLLSVNPTVAGQYLNSAGVRDNLKCLAVATINYAKCLYIDIDVRRSL